jgi:hypothetical protein
MNPNCPEKGCHRLLRVRHLKSLLGMTGCPNCKTSESKPYILTAKKEGMRRCLRCKQDYKPKVREGYGRYWICKDHPWQKFKVGAEVIRCKSKIKSDNEVNAMLKRLSVEQARERRQPNVRMPS